MVASLPIDINIVAIALMEFFGVAFFLSAFASVKQARKISGKSEALQEALRNRATLNEGNWRPCYSYRWVISNSMKSRSPVARLIGAIGVGGFLIMCIGFLSVAMGLALLIIFQNAGYTLLIGLIGAAIILETDALEAYGYSKAVQKVTLGQLVEEDQSYMEIAKQAFEMATTRFLIVGATFVVVGPFIPQIFDSFCYALALYMRYTLFQAVESVNALAVFIAIILPGILLYLPELVAKNLFRKIRKFIRGVLERGGKQ